MRIFIRENVIIQSINKTTLFLRYYSEEMYDDVYEPFQDEKIIAFSRNTALAIARKIYSRSNISPERLNGLALIPIGTGILNELDMVSTITDLAKFKVRKFSF